MNHDHCTVLLHYGELALKGRNKHRFIRQLLLNLRDNFPANDIAKIERLEGRAMVKFSRPWDDELHTRLQCVYGFADYSPAHVCAPTLDALKSTACDVASKLSYESMRVTARRGVKKFPYDSMEIQRVVGSALMDLRPVPVKMKHADLNVRIEVMEDRAFVFAEKIKAAGGLPVGSSGRVLALLSGGIDSPVAAARMQRRGCQVVFLHFHSQPYQSSAGRDKAMALAQHLARYQVHTKIILAPLGDLQREIITHCPHKLVVVLYRRFMFRIAERLAKQNRCKALITGESLGQVASQTLTNIQTINEAISLPVLRPLIGFDKLEIINQAIQLGTYDTSIQPDQDCCQLFMPTSPETHASIDEIMEAESALNIKVLCDDVIKRTELLSVEACW